MIKHLSLLLLCGFFAAAAFAAKPDDYVALTTGTDGKLSIEGNLALADQKSGPASTFKVLITWAALEEGIVTPQTKFLINDKHVPGTPREVTLHEAMYYSSNTYFVWLAKKMGREKLEKYIALSGYAGGKVPQGWLADINQAAAGDTITISPRENHEFMKKVAGGKLVSSAKVQEELLQALRWPCKNPDCKLYGKTGTYRNAVWFNGFGIKNGECKVVTLYMPGGVELRPRIVAAFYESFKEQFDPAWLNDYPQ